jgi:hypothetical protein
MAVVRGLKPLAIAAFSPVASATSTVRPVFECALGAFRLGGRVQNSGYSRRS